MFRGQPVVKGHTTQRRKTESFAFPPTIENEAYGPMAKTAASVVEKFILLIHPLTMTQIPTAMNAPPTM